jgi:multidrug efflux pump subunit AcrA (membrane-fusion protein)
MLAALIPGTGLLVAFTLPGISTPAPLNGTVALVSQGTITTTVTPSGQTQDITQYALNFQASGTVKSVMVNQGSQVKKNQILATLDDPTLQITLLNDQSSVRSAQASLAKELAPPNPNSITQARASLIEAQLKLAALKQGGTSQFGKVQAHGPQVGIRLVHRQRPGKSRLGAAKAYRAGVRRIIYAGGAGRGIAGIRASQVGIDGKRGLTRQHYAGPTST